MKVFNKVKVFNLVSLVISILMISSCDNFMQGSLIKEEIEKEIKYANSPYITLSINADVNQGTTVPAATVYKEKYKVSDKETIEFTSRPDYQFLYWSASPSENVKFGDARSTTTWFEIIEGAGTEIVITPVCAERPYPTVSPNNTGDNKPKNTPVTISFDYTLQNPEEDLAGIDIQIAGESILSHFKAPKYTDEQHRTILFDADDSKLLDFTTGTRVVNVIIPDTLYYTMPDGTEVHMSSSVTTSFTIDYKTRDSAVLTLDIDDKNAGKLNRSGNQTFYMGEEFTVIYTMSEGYQFAGWNESLSEGIEGTVETKDGKVYLNDFAVLEVVPNGDDFDEEYYASMNKYQRIYRVLAGSRDIIIKPNYYVKPIIQSVSPLNTETVAKNNPIIITFSKKMNISEEELGKISITSDGIDIRSYFETPVIGENNLTGTTEITFNAKRSNLLSVPVGTKNITVTIPDSFSYIQEGDNVTLPADYVYTYVVNNNTVDEVNLQFIYTSGECTLDASSTKTLYLDGTYTVHCTPDTKYEVTGWKVYLLNKSNEADESGTVADEVLETKVSEDNSTIDFTALAGISGTVIVKPVCHPKKKVTVTVNSTHGTTIPAGKVEKTYYSGDEISISYREEADYQFVGWTITEADAIDLSTILEFDVSTIDGVKVHGSDQMDTSIKINKLNKDINISIVANCEQRPQIVSASPLYDTEGVYRDRKITIMYDQKLSVETIYYSTEEIKAIKAENPNVTVNFLGEENKKYGYQLGTDKNTIVYKCVSITELQNTNKNLLQYYGAPAFDDSNSGVLRIPVKSKAIVPPGSTDILVKVKPTFGKNVEINGTTKLITLYSEYSWSYFTNSYVDNTAPQISNLSIKVVGSNGTKDDWLSLTTDEMFSTTNLSTFRGATASTDEKLKTFSKYNAIENKKLWVEAKVTDGGSGPKSLSGKIYPVNCSYYPAFTNAELETPSLTYDAKLTFSGANAEIRSTAADGTNLNGDYIDLSKIYLNKSGLYKIVFTAIDKNDIESDDVNAGGVEAASYYFLWDDEEPALPTDLREERSARDKTSLKFTKSTAKDYARVEVYSKRIRGTNGEQITEDPLEPKKFETDSTKTTLEIGGLTNQTQYEYTLKFFDYVGNSVETTIKDEVANTLVNKEKVTNSRTSASYETIKWSDFTETLDFDHAIVECWKGNDKVSEFNGLQTYNETAIKENTFSSLVNQTRYEYRFYSVDYSGNRSSSYTSYQDTTGPTSLVTKSNISNSRTSADTETISWSANPTGTDVDHIEIDRYYSSSDKATFKQTSSSTKSNTFTGLTDQHKYEYSFYSVDYSGNRSASCTKYTDETAPAKPTIKYSEGKDGRVIIYYTTPNDSDYAYVKAGVGSSSASQESLSESTSKNSSVSHTFSGTNGTTYKYYLRSYDYSGNASECLEIEEIAGAMPGMICYGTTKNNIFCSKNYWCGKTPIGIVADGHDQKKVRILALDQDGRYKYGDYNNLSTEENFTDLAIANKNTESYNNTDGIEWWKLVSNTDNSNYETYVAAFKDKDSIWSYLKDVKNKSTPVTWWIPARHEWQYVARNWESMSAAITTLQNNSITVAEMENKNKEGRAYYVSTPNKSTGYCGLVGVYYDDDNRADNDISRLTVCLEKGATMTLYTNTAASKDFRRNIYYGYVRAMAFVDMQ